MPVLVGAELTAPPVLFSPGANIFLTDECRCLKLGDFGCSVKIVAHTTMQGEVKGLVGTPGTGVRLAAGRAGGSCWGSD